MLTSKSQLLNNILSSIDPTAANQFAQAGRQTPTTNTPTTNTPRPVQRSAAGNNETSQAQPLKRKADGQPGGGQVKMQRKDAPTPSDRAILPTRPASTQGVTKPKAPVTSNAVPYRGTVGNGGQGATKVVNTIAAKPSAVTRTPSALGKPSVPLAKVAGTAAPPTAAPVTTKKGGYAAMLQRAAQTQQAKPAAPPVKHEVTKILTKKEREALRAEQMAAAKGKKPVATPAGRNMGIKTEMNKEKKKPVDLGYQGTARPAKKPVEIGYKGTARPISTPAGSAGRAAGPAKPKPKSGQGRYTGYAAWSDDDRLEEEEEEDGYDSAASSDMEADAWDMENEEELALKAAKKEDALALKEENEAKRLKEERKKKLMALNKAAAAKRKY
jgi:hypothetical protein